MPSAYSLAYRSLRAVYRLLPSPIRRLEISKYLSGGVVQKFHNFAPHDEIYTEAYYRNGVDPPAVLAAPPITNSIIRDLAPRRVVDVGCGTGALLKELKDRGCECFGLEYSTFALKLCRERGLNVEQFDLEKGAACFPQNSFDVAISVEVAEHLPASCADKLVSLMTTLAPRIVFTAALPGQGGTDHINEQPHEYWIEKFVARGFAYDETMARKWREEWKNAGVAGFYHHNAMIFRKTA